MKIKVIMNMTVRCMALATLTFVVLSCSSGGGDDPAEPPNDGRYLSANIGTLRYVPAGQFQRDATPTHISVITNPYRVSEHEITRAQFLDIMGADPSDVNDSCGTGDPVQNINWYHAITFCNKLSLLEGLTPVYTVSVGGTLVNWSTLRYADIPTTGSSHWNSVVADWDANGYRLPTEMEWMWAAMGAPADGQNGGTNTTGYAKAFAGSTGSNNIDNYAWRGSNSDDTSHPVGTKLPNELGLYDMSGNVWEWCWDWYSDYPRTTQVDYRGPGSDVFRVRRGGSWYYVASYCTVADRDFTNPGDNAFNIGFRVVRN